MSSSSVVFSLFSLMSTFVNDLQADQLIDLLNSKGDAN